MLKLSCIPACALAIGLSVSASAQTANISLSQVQPFGVSLALGGNNAISYGDITLGLSPSFAHLDYAMPGNFITNNGGTFSVTPGFGTEKINIDFRPFSGSNYAFGNNLGLLQFQGGGDIRVTLDPALVNLYDTSNNKISITGRVNVLILHMEAVPEPGAYPLGLALTAGLSVWGIRRRK